jgi:hypothetical protein
MKKLDTITSLACAIINNLVAYVDVTEDAASSYEIHDGDGKVIGWYAAMTNSGDNVQMGGRNINVRAYIEIPSHGNDYWGEVEIIVPDKKRSRFDSLKIKVSGDLYDEDKCCVCNTYRFGEDILDDIEDRYEEYKKLLIAML